MIGPNNVEGFAVGPFQSNTYILSDAGEALVVDPGDEASRIAAHIRSKGLKVVAILLTHAHLDHIGAVRELEELWGVDSYLHPADRFLADRLPESCALYGLPRMEPPTRLKDLHVGDKFRAGALEVITAAAPGHSPGHVIFIGSGFAIVGDVIFSGSVGRVDLPGGDGPTLLRSIQDSVLTLPDSTVLFSGHGPPTTVGEERDSNPYLEPGALG